MATTLINHIEITPETCSGKPRIAGHRIKVQDVVIWHERMGMSPDEIVDHYPSITLADIYAALSYYANSKMKRINLKSWQRKYRGFHLTLST